MRVMRKKESRKEQAKSWVTYFLEEYCCYHHRDNHTCSIRLDLVYNSCISAEHIVSVHTCYVHHSDIYSAYMGHDFVADSLVLLLLGYLYDLCMVVMHLKKETNNMHYRQWQCKQVYPTWAVELHWVQDQDAVRIGGGSPSTGWMAFTWSPEKHTGDMLIGGSQAVSSKLEPSLPYWVRQGRNFTIHLFVSFVVSPTDV